MFPFPIASLLRIAAHSPTRTIPRARTSTPLSSRWSRFLPTPSARFSNSRSLVSPARRLALSPCAIPSRPFTKSSRRYFNGNNRYNRFAGSREPLLQHLLRKARPIHFVGIGGIISGFYIYNTDTVEVRIMSKETVRDSEISAR